MAARTAKERTRAELRPVRYVVRPEIGAAWSKRAKRNAIGYLSLKLDHATFDLQVQKNLLAVKATANH